ncbi:hypothetical protein DICPUDRAFT_146642 [Dictyostelium purpureum]|uniref:CCHC-type domain-containing protein n=1 Tax=Dictyostelium purpureum TaxID=5786 RepID=F0Z6H5_DICPU|nr:uncharacterized protein DICPUDRAFT_146642 [Dictyostelium purpureum]EGC40440.1 hypothetical protein DICPUDRAFT_146642 [Dictyostelium purpureum]|eukprot:XP_003282987.1 hypothetical protein DICPUDRAFT_146642 [Dictyostelium purpureum]
MFPFNNQGDINSNSESNSSNLERNDVFNNSLNNNNFENENSNLVNNNNKVKNNYQVKAEATNPTVKPTGIIPPSQKKPTVNNNSNNAKLKEQELKMMELINNQMKILKELNFQPNRTPFPEESKFDGANKAEFDKNWDLFEFLFRHHFVRPTSANLLSSLRGSAIDRLRSIDPFNSNSVEDNILRLRRYYQDSPSVVLDRFSNFSRENKFKSLDALLLVFSIVKKRSNLPDEAAITFLNQALGCNFKDYLALKCRKDSTYQEYLEEVRNLEIAFTESKGVSLYLIKEPLNGIFGTNRTPNVSMANANNPSFNVAGISNDTQNMSVVCYSCGMEGHFSRNCQNKDKFSQNRSNRYINSNHRNSNNYNQNGYNQNNYNNYQLNRNKSNNQRSSFNSYNNNNSNRNRYVNQQNYRDRNNSNLNNDYIGNDVNVEPTINTIASVSGYKKNHLQKDSISQLTQVKKSYNLDSDISSSCILGLNGLNAIGADPILSKSKLVCSKANCYVPLYSYTENSTPLDSNFNPAQLNSTSVNVLNYQSLKPKPDNNCYRINSVRYVNKSESIFSRSSSHPDHHSSTRQTSIKSNNINARNSNNFNSNSFNSNNNNFNNVNSRNINKFNRNNNNFNNKISKKFKQPPAFIKSLEQTVISADNHSTQNPNSTPSIHNQVYQSAQDGSIILTAVQQAQLNNLLKKYVRNVKRILFSQGRFNSVPSNFQNRGENVV